MIKPQLHSEPKPASKTKSKRQLTSCEECEDVWHYVKFCILHGNQDGAFKHLLFMLESSQDGSEIHHKMQSRVADKISELLNQRNNKRKQHTKWT